MSSVLVGLFTGAIAAKSGRFIVQSAGLTIAVAVAIAATPSRWKDSNKS